MSHDINHSGTMRELAREFGLSGWRIWLEILSISDRVGECIDCTSQGALSRLTSAAETRLSTTSAVLQWLLRHDCVATVDELKHITRVVNYRDFHRTEEQKPLPPDLPDHTKPDQTNKNKIADAYSFDFERAWKINGYGSKAKAWEAWKKVGAHVLLYVRNAIFDGLTAEAEWRKRAENYKATCDPQFFIPPWKNLVTWLNQKCWTQGLREIPKEARKNNGFNLQSSSNERLARALKQGLPNE